ncbi:MAG TPA: hypothetical protein VK766_07160 [Cytophagaceae bacterium]|jgi:hypothetical protein|nr:hypothetical protein [Cytophagaceae bacterium]
MSTPDQLEKVKSGYMQLDAYDRGEVRKFIEEFEKKPDVQKITESKSFSDRIKNRSLGPTSSATCPCCGK